MKITRIQTAVLSGYGDWILVRIETDQGISGLGECFPALAGGAGPTREAVQVASRILMGEDPREVNRLWTHLYDYFLGRPGSMAGLITTVLSGLETALLDILGKSLQTPLYRLLGGRYRQRIRLYADCGAAQDGDPAEDARRALEAVSQGFTAVKLDADPQPFPHVFRPQDWYEGSTPAPGRPSPQDSYSKSLSRSDIGRIAARVGAVREAVGEDVDICLDTPGYTVESACRLARALEPHGLLWLEDPLPRENTEPLRLLRSSTSTPILTGECLYTRFGFQRLLEQGGVDIIAPDVQKTGGVLETKRIADLASLHYVTIAPHCVATPVGTAAAAHLCAAVPNFLVLEFHSLSLPYWSDLIKGPRTLLEQGFLHVPEGPGLGVELDEEAARRYCRDGEVFS